MCCQSLSRQFGQLKPNGVVRSVAAGQWTCKDGIDQSEQMLTVGTNAREDRQKRLWRCAVDGLLHRLSIAKHRGYLSSRLTMLKRVDVGERVQITYEHDRKRWRLVPVAPAGRAKALASLRPGVLARLDSCLKLLGAVSFLSALLRYR
jgi:antitoxin (DNA-binding transcriptional repressor) of toxin-antitoxin stability system